MPALKQLRKNGWNLSIDKYPDMVYVHDIDSNGVRRFVGRFKCHKPSTNARAFAKFLVQHFTPAEFFAAHDGGMAPLKILESKGYVSPNMRAATAVRPALVVLWTVQR